MNASLDTVRSQAFVFTYISRLARVEYEGGKLERKKNHIFKQSQHAKNMCFGFGFWILDLVCSLQIPGGRAVT
jgi:hypothetical protein